LSKAAIIQPSAAQADIRLDIGCDHSVISYCAMLDYEYTKASPLQPKDQQTWAHCVFGPREMSVNAGETRILAGLVNEFGDGAKRIVERQRARQHWTGDA
jgi:hypothetical protein